MNSDQFTYRGRHLRKWLLQLVEESHEDQHAAGRAIMFLYAGPKELDPEEAESWTREFEKEVKRVFQQRGFPKKEYAKKLLQLPIQLRKFSEVKAKEDQKWHLEQNKKMGKRPSVKAQLRYLEKSIQRLDQEELRINQERGLAAVCFRYVVECLGRELLPAKKQLREMLRTPRLADLACGAIERMGKAGKEFFPDLLAGLSKKDAQYPHAKALGSLLRQMPEKLPEVFKLTGSKNKTLRCHAVMALGFTGRKVVKKFPKAETRARLHLSDPADNKSLGWWPVLRTAGDYEWHAWAWMLGETAVTKATVNEFLKVTRSGNKHRTGKAIECLGRIGLDGKRVVPRLIELMDEFVEFDHREGAQARVTEALSSFGREAKPAIPALSRHIWMECRMFNSEPKKMPDYTVIRLLGTFGPAAKEVLPALQLMKKELSREGLAPELVEAIAKIEGKP
jgi:hypothetical protein